MKNLNSNSRQKSSENNFRASFILIIGVISIVLLLLMLLGHYNSAKAQNKDTLKKSTELSTGMPIQYVLPKNVSDTAFWHNQIILLHNKVDDLENSKKLLTNLAKIQEQKLSQLTARIDSLSAAIESKENKKKK